MAANRARRHALESDPRIRQLLIERVQPTGRELGSGAYGSVEELVIDGVFYAGKRLHEALLEHGNADVQNLVRKYVEECQLLSNLRHPHVVQFIGLCFFGESSLPVLIMELLLTNLDHLLENTPEIPLALKRSMLADVSKGLVYLHSHNPPIIHRDLSAKNVLLNSAMVAKISDLGNSRIVTVEPLNLARSLSLVPGAVVYMPPEAFERTSPYGPKLDVFSFGHLALFTLIQVFPQDLLAPTYKDPNNHKKLIARSEVERRENYIDELHQQLGERHPMVQLVEQCLNNDPNDRPPANAILQQLECMRIPDAYHHLTKVEMMKLLKRKDGDIHSLQSQLQQVQLRKEQITTELQAQVQHKDTEIRVLQLSKNTMAVELQAQIQCKDADIQALKLNKDQMTTELQAQIQCKDADIRALKLSKDQMTTELQAQVQHKETEIRVLQLSKEQITTELQAQVQHKETEIRVLQLSKNTMAVELQAQIQCKDADIQALKLSKDQMTTELQAQIQHGDRDIRALQKHIQRKNALLCKKDALLHQKDEQLALFRSQETSQSPPKPKGPISVQKVIQESEPKMLPTDMQQIQEPDLSEATSIPDHVELILGANQHMLTAKVFQQNFTLLYQHLTVGDILPNLVEKGIISEAKRKNVELYIQKCAQSIVVINAIFKWKCPPDVLVRLTDVLAITPGQEQVAKKLRDDFKQLSISAPSPDALPGPLLTTPIMSDFSELSQLFQQTLHGIMNAFDDVPTILGVVMETLSSLVLPLGNGKVARLVEVASFQHARTHRDVFRMISPYWNCLATDLLQFITEASGSSLAVANLSAFTQARSSKGHLLVCYSQAPSKPQQDDLKTNASISPGHRSVHTGPLEALQSLHPAVFTRLHEHKAVASRNTIRITAEVDKRRLSLSDYEAVMTAVCAFFSLPRPALVYSGCSLSPTILCWLVSADVMPYIESVNVGLSGNRLLAECNVSGIAVGDVISYMCPKIKTVELLEASAYGQIERVCDLLPSVNIDATDINGFTALHWACQNQHCSVVSLLLENAADLHLTTNRGYGATPLMLACIRGHTTVVQLLTKAKVNVNQLSRTQQRTTLTIAARNGHLEIVIMLIQNKGNIHKKDKDGFTPLHQACQKGHSAVVSVLLEHGADLHVTTNKGNCVTPLMLACMFGWSEVVKILVEAKADVNQLSGRERMTALMFAAQEGHMEVLNKLVQNGADIHMKNKSGATALVLACQNGHKEIAALLVSAKANINHRDIEQFTPLHLACWFGHSAVVSLLLEHGADLHLTTNKGNCMTPLMLACMFGWREVVKILVEAKADVNQMSGRGKMTALMFAAREGHLEILDWLIQNGGNIHMKNENGLTPLHYACKNGHSTVVSLLLEYAAGPHLTSNKGNCVTPLMLACINGRSEVVNILVEAKADVNQMSGRGKMTALMFAAQGGHLEILNLLIQNGANIYMKNEEWNTALDLAREKGYTEICQLLCSHK